jgi:hypothetical protein
LYWTLYCVTDIFFDRTCFKPWWQWEGCFNRGSFEWLIKVINNKTIAINTAQSKVHIVTYKSDKSLFLVSPKIFKEYDVDQWAKTQKQFGRLKINKIVGKIGI